MDRARRAAITALILVLVVAASAGFGGGRVLAGTVAWPPSTLVVSEVQTGGTSASDEFVELANQGAAPVDLAGLEVVYATSSGTTVTRKATWASSILLEPGRRILLANASGIYSGVADLTYSGGFAATGGSIALRLVGGGSIDALGWGDATNAFVEGTAAPAPPTGSSLERAPGGSAGNGTDTNDNLADWFVQGGPSPQGLGAPPVPAAVPPPTPAPTATPMPTPSPTATPTVTPTPIPSPTPTPTPTPTPSPTPMPTPTPTQTPRPIAEARSLPDDATVIVEGTLTTALGALESGRGGFIQDMSGGIALYLDATVTSSWPAGTTVMVEGTVTSRYAQRTLRIAEASLLAVGSDALPPAITLESGATAEAFEGARVRVRGTVTEAPGALADGLGVTIDDGSGPIRAVVGDAALAGQTVQTGMIVTVTGPLGQRDSSGTGSSGYRVHSTIAGEAQVSPASTPSPTPSLTPTPTPAATATPIPTATPTPTAPPGPTATPVPTTTPSPTPTPVPTPSSTPPVVTLAVVRAQPLGSTVRATGVVIAEAGRLGTPSLLAIGDATGGLVVHLPAGAATYDRGTTLDIAGTLAAPYGQLEIRPAKSDIRVLGTGNLPPPIAVPAPGLSETTEGRLATATGRLTGKPKKTAGGDITLILERNGGAAVKVMADASSRIATGSLQVGATYRVVGVAGQRASRSGVLDGYRLWARDGADLVAIAPAGAPGTSPTPGTGAGSGTPGASAPSGALAAVSIAHALGITDRAVAIDAVVTAPGTLLDATGRRIVVQDGSGAIEILVPTGQAAPPIGARVHAEGRIGIAYGAPRLRADRLETRGTGPLPAPIVLHGSPTVVHEWRLVTVTGRVSSIHKLGTRWRAELLVGTQLVVVVGQAGSGIASIALVEGRTVTVTGVARRPDPSATDRRFVVTPRFPADLRQAGAPTVGGVGLDKGSRGPAASSGPGWSIPTDGRDRQAQATVDVDLIDLGAHLGAVVRVGGIVVDRRADGFSLDDGTAVGRVVLRGGALDLLPLVEPDDAVNAIGHVEKTADGFVVGIDDPAGLIQTGDPIAATPTASADAGILAPAPSDERVEGSRLAGLGGESFPVGAGAVGLGGLLAISVASLAVTLLRREQSRRRLAARIAGRLATLAGSRSISADASLAERESSTIRSA